MSTQSEKLPTPPPVGRVTVRKSGWEGRDYCQARHHGLQAQTGSHYPSPHNGRCAKGESARRYEMRRGRDPQVAPPVCSAWYLIPRVTVRVAPDNTQPRDVEPRQPIVGRSGLCFQSVECFPDRLSRIAGGFPLRQGCHDSPCIRAAHGHNDLLCSGLAAFPTEYAHIILPRWQNARRSASEERTSGVLATRRMKRYKRHCNASISKMQERCLGIGTLTQSAPIDQRGLRHVWLYIE